MCLDDKWTLSEKMTLEIWEKSYVSTSWLKRKKMKFMLFCVIGTSKGKEHKIRHLVDSFNVMRWGRKSNMQHSETREKFTHHIMMTVQLFAQTLL